MYVRLNLAAILCLLAAAGCATRRDRVAVGSKDGPEQAILGEIVAQHLEARLGAEIDRQLNLGRTTVVHQALTANQIDVYPEYSGAAWVEVLKMSGSTSREELFSEVRNTYRSRWDVEWLDPLGFDNAIVMAVRAQDAPASRKLSDAQDREWRLGIDYDFELRPDGLVALNTAYDLRWQGAAVTMPAQQLYKALEQKHVDMIAGRATDSGTAGEQMAILADDRGAFPPYQAALVVRRDSFARHPQFRDALAQLSGKIKLDAMRRMIHDINVRRAPVKEVAGAFLRSLPR